MKNDEKIIKYIEGDLTPEERTAFETDLRNSPQIKAEFEKYLKVNQRIKDSKKVRLNRDYQDSIVPEFRNNISHQNSISLKRNLGYAFGVMLVFILALMVLKYIPTESSENNSVKEFTESLNDDQKIDLLEHLNGDLDDLNMISENIADMKLTNLLQSELKINNDVAEAYNINYTELIDELNQVEAEKIYKEILNKNFSEEVNL